VPTVEKLPDGGVVVTFDSEDTYAMKVEIFKNPKWDGDGFNTFIRHSLLSEYQLARRVGMRKSVLIEKINQCELDHRKNMLNLVVGKPLMETYLLYIGSKPK
jgi:hypothetical protein